MLVNFVDVSAQKLLFKVDVPLQIVHFDFFVFKLLFQQVSASCQNHLEVQKSGGPFHLPREQLFTNLDLGQHVSVVQPGDDVNNYALQLVDSDLQLALGYVETRPELVDFLRQHS